MDQRMQRGDPNRVEHPSRARSGFSSSRVWWVCFAASVAIHFLAVAIYPFFGNTVNIDAISFSFPNVSGRTEGIQVLRLVEVADPIASERPDDPEEIEDVDDPEPPMTPVPIEGTPDPELIPPPPSGAELLRPNLSNPILWEALSSGVLDITLKQREQLLIASALARWNDSAATSLAAEAAAMDWTFTDDDGKRWGVSPGKIHLGDITLPLPFGFGTVVGKREEVNDRLWQWDEIYRQGVRAEVNESWRDRAEAIRRRRDRERTAVQPDTSRIPR